MKSRRFTCEKTAGQDGLLRCHVSNCALPVGFAKTQTNSLGLAKPWNGNNVYVVVLQLIDRRNILARSEVRYEFRQRIAMTDNQDYFSFVILENRFEHSLPVGRILSVHFQVQCFGQWPCCLPGAPERRGVNRVDALYYIRVDKLPRQFRYAAATGIT